MTNLAGPRHFGAERSAPTDRRFVPGQPDMWFFVLFEALVFTSYFVVYMILRTQHPELYLRSQSHLSLSLGVIETLVLLASSWSMARCVQASRAGGYRSALTHASLTLGLGVVFVAAKVFEWTRLIRMGYGFSANEFFSQYFFLTAIHLLHVLIGFVAVGVIIYQLRGTDRRSQELVETGATYWHTVDFLWIVIFALLYVVR